MEEQGNGVLRAVVNQWLAKIENAKRHKNSVWGTYARECSSFFDGPKNWDELMNGARGGGGEGDPSPDFKIAVNKTYEFVSIFGPYLYSDNPVRTVKPRMPVSIPPEFFPDMNVYQSLEMQEQIRVLADTFRAQLVERYLNWTPLETGLDVTSRSAIDEALIKGRGCIWTELYQPPGASFRIIRSRFDSVENLLIDPDASCIEEAKWIALRCKHPVWEVERAHPEIQPGVLHGNCESQAAQSFIDKDEAALYDRKRGYTNDLLTYWKLWSKMGIGGRLEGLPKYYREPLEAFGDHCYLELAESVPWPLNLPPATQAAPDVNQIIPRVEWPTPFWRSGSGWPVSLLDFKRLSNCPWPMPILKAGMGELKFLNWVMSFLAGHIRNSSRDFLAVKKEAGEELKTALLEGKDLTLIELEAEHSTIAELVQFLQHPQVNGDIWKMIEAVEANFDKRVGLNELMYGGVGQTQPRSASEVNLRTQASQIRPDDMSRQVEAWQSEIATKEAVAARVHLNEPDISPVLGVIAGSAWDTYVSTDNPQDAFHQLEYRIEAGSTRRPNKEFEVRQMTEAVQVIGPILQVAYQSGDATPLNNLLADFAKTRDLDPNRYLLQPPMIAQPGVPPGQEGQGAQGPAGGPTPGEEPAFKQGP